MALEARAIEREARRSLDTSDGTIPPDATVLDALPVCTREAVLHGWLVPVAAGDRLVAFLRFTPQRVLTGRSILMRGPGRVDDCPMAADWLDPERIRARAQLLAVEDEEAGAPFLSFDGVPDRLAWAVPLQQKGGQQRWVFVAGTTAWPDRGAGGLSTF